MKCLCRFQVSDMGYYECQLERYHNGNHSFSHDGKSSWPSVPYKIEWEQNAERDIIFTEEMLKETNLEDIYADILKMFDIVKVTHNYTDDSLHGETPILWIYAKYKEDFNDSEERSEEFYEILWDLESEIRNYIDEKLIYKGKLVNEYQDLLQTHLSMC